MTDNPKYCRYPVNEKRNCMEKTVGGSDFCDGHKDTWPQNMGEK